MYSKTEQIKTTKRKKIKKISLSKLVKELDIIFSKVVRGRDKKCLKCGTTNNLQCAHIASRKHRAGRWSEHNAITLCYACHIHWWHKEPIEASEWLKSMYPSVWEESLEVKRTLANYKREDYEIMLEQLRIRLKILESL